MVIYRRMKKAKTLLGSVALAAALPLPAHYGRNLDALHDVLTEFGGSWTVVFRNAGAVARGLRAVCADAAETPGLQVSFEDRS